VSGLTVSDLTFSIVARDRKTGQLGVAVQSHWFAVGAAVPWVRAGVGAVATQSFTDIVIGSLGLKMMAAGKDAKQTLDSLLQSDRNSEDRQVAIVDSRGSVAVHTGRKCFPNAGHFKGDQFSCQGNLMKNSRVWEAMAESYLANKQLEFPERLIAALEGGQEVGGDIRGKQSACLLVVSEKPLTNEFQGKLVDLRVDDHPDPIRELRRLMRLRRGYDLATSGDILLIEGKSEDAMKAYAKSVEYVPEEDELKYWQAVTLIQIGRVSEGKVLLKRVFKKNRNWLALTRMLADKGLFPNDPKILKDILSSS
jgi:uncharacterized Ntn-hydrolase superfamily protein